MKIDAEPSRNHTSDPTEAANAAEWSTFIVRDESEFSALEGEWNSLAETNTVPFARHEWFMAAYEIFYAKRKPYIVGVRRNGKLVAVCPLIDERFGPITLCEIIGVAPIAEWGCMPVDDLEAFQPLIAAIAKIGRAVILHRLRHDMPGQTSLTTALSLVQHVQIRRSASPALNLPFYGTWEEYFGTLSSSRRKQLRRKRRQAEKLGEVTFRIVEPGPEDIDEPFETFAAVEHASWKGEDGVSLNASPKVKAFFRRIMKSFAESGDARFFFLEIDGKPAAAQMALDYGNRLWGLKIGYDESFHRISPGVLLDEKVFEYCFDHRIACYEFLGKAENNETFWNPETRSFANLHIYPYTFRSAAGFAVVLGESRIRWLHRKIAGALSRSATTKDS